MSKYQVPSLDNAFLSLGFGLNQDGFEKLQARGLYKSYNIGSFANEVFITWRMRNDAFLIRFTETPDSFGFIYESEITSIEDGWKNFAQYWVEQAEDYLSGAWFNRQNVYHVGVIPRTNKSLKGFLPFGEKRDLWDKPLLEAVLKGELTFEFYKARIEHLQKLAENHIKRHARRFHLNQIINTTDPKNIIFSEF